MGNVGQTDDILFTEFTETETDTKHSRIFIREQADTDNLFGLCFSLILPDNSEPK